MELKHLFTYPPGKYGIQMLQVIAYFVLAMMLPIVIGIMLVMILFRYKTIAELKSTFNRNTDYVDPITEDEVLMQHLLAARKQRQRTILKERLYNAAIPEPDSSL